jgi:hypothetical protein
MYSCLRITAFLILLCLSLGSISILTAQQVSTFTLTGRVLDDSTGSPIEKVNVYIANSTLGSPTDVYGVFRIRNVPAGTHELVASIVGYAVNSSFIKVADSSQRAIEVRLKPRALEFGPVEVVGADPSAWRKDLARFTESFFGKGPNADLCRIVNPEVLSFTSDRSETLEARASVPLRIENNGLGYEVELQLITFIMGPRWLTYGWRAFFREMVSVDDNQRASWQKSRVKAYTGSLRHFLASLVNVRAEKEGFSVYEVPNPRLSNSRMRMPVSEDEVLSPGAVSNEKLLRFLDYLEVEFESGPGITLRNPRWMTTGSNSQVSWLRLSRDYVTINSMGGYVEPYSLNVSGEWALQRVADALPFDYAPPKNK